jgi:hypothetical protein
LSQREETLTAAHQKSLTDTPEVLRGGAFLLSPLTAAGGFDSRVSPAWSSVAGFAGASSCARGGGLAAGVEPVIGRAISVGMGSCDFATEGGFSAAGFLEVVFGCFAVFGVLATAGAFAMFAPFAAGGAFAVAGFFAVFAAFGLLVGFAAGGAFTAFGGFESVARSGLPG